MSVPAVHAAGVGEPVAEPERGEARPGRVPRVREPVAGHGVATVHRVRPPQVPHLERVMKAKADIYRADGVDAERKRVLGLLVSLHISS